VGTLQKDRWADAALVAAARSGDRSSFDVLVRRYGRRTETVVRAVCGDRAESQDLTQEAFIRAWTNLDLLVAPERFAAWVARIGFACAVDWLRGRRPAPAGEALLEDLAAPQPLPEAALAGRELAAEVRAAIARLPARYRRPLTLYHLDGLRQDRIAAALGTAPGTVRSLVTRARQALRAELAHIEVDAELLEDPIMRKLVHVCNGHSTVRLLQQGGVPGLFRLWCDPLLLGPCPPLWGEPWRQLRLGFLTGRGTPPGAPAPGEEVWDDELQGLLAGPGDLDEMVLWYEHDLYDQLLLIRLLAVVAQQGGRRLPLSLVCIGEHPAVPAFMGLGQLTPDQLASLFETRAELSEEMIALGRDAWAAYTDPDPRTLTTFLERDLSLLPFLDRALRRHLEEYPGLDDGLSRTERHLLRLVEGGVTDAAVVWHRLHAAEDCHYVADSWFLDILERLASPPAPVLTIAGPRSTLQCVLSITSLGEQILRGGRDWLEEAGIDRWLGGVHLTHAATAWRWDPSTRQLHRRGP
jgi:RNA polymerase sigma factor (sigma-70 family)